MAVLSNQQILMMPGWLEDHWVQEMQCSGSDAVLFQTPLLTPQQMNFIWHTRQSRQKLNCCLLFSIPMAWEKWVRDLFFLHYLQHFCPTGILPRGIWFSTFYDRLWRIITNLIYQMRNCHVDSTQISAFKQWIHVCFDPAFGASSISSLEDNLSWQETQTSG